MWEELSLSMAWIRVRVVGQLSEKNDCLKVSWIKILYFLVWSEFFKIPVDFYDAPLHPSNLLGTSYTICQLKETATSKNNF